MVIVVPLHYITTDALYSEVNDEIYYAQSNDYWLLKAQLFDGNLKRHKYSINRISTHESIHCAIVTLRIRII